MINRLSKHFSFLVFVCVFVFACSPPRGISHRLALNLSKTPPPDCVEQALRSVDGVSLADPDANAYGYHYEYYIDDMPAVLRMHKKDGEDTVYFSNGASYFHGITQEQADFVRPVMFEIDAAVETFCNIPNLSKDVVEKCYDDVKCPDLNPEPRTALNP